MDLLENELNNVCHIAGENLVEFPACNFSIADQHVNILRYGWG